MSLTITIKERQPRKLDLLTAVLGNRAEAHRAVGEAAASVIAKHFGQLDSERDRYSRFYEEAAKGTLLGQVDDAGASVEIHKLGVAQRYFGGPIEPKNVQFLTIPAAEESFGKTVETVEQDVQLGVRYGAGGVPRALVELVQETSEKTGRPFKSPRPGGKVLFWLVKHVDQEPDPTVLPEPDEIRTAVVDALSLYMTDTQFGKET